MRHLLVLAALLVTALPLPAQEEPEPPAFGEVIDVRVINVEAVVTGRGGERVRGLSKDDFQLLVDGREVPIEFFNEVVDGTMVNGELVTGEPSAADVVGRSVLVFVDDSFAIASQRNIVLDQIGASLARLSPHDQVAIAAFDGKRLERLLDWTSEAGRISAALAVERGRKPDGLTARVHEIQEFPDFGERLSNAVNAAAAAMSGLPAPPGRKVMLLLSGGWPLVEAPSRRAFGDRNSAWTDTGSGEDFFRPLIDTANLLGYTLYPVDVPGFSSGAGPGVLAEAPGPAGPITSGREQATDYALNFLAQATGGKAAVNSARLEALERMAADTSAYYWLGFTPAWKADDQQHRIELKPRRRGLRVRTRNGFTDVSCQTQVLLNADGTLVSSPCFAP